MLGVGYSTSKHHLSAESAAAFWVTDVSKRTVLWQASDEVLRSAGVRNIVSVHNSKVRIGSMVNGIVGAPADVLSTLTPSFNPARGP